MTIWWRNVVLGIMDQCHSKIDLVKYMWVSDLYFMIHWFCLISLSYTYIIFIIKKWHRLWVFIPLRVLALVLRWTHVTTFLICWFFVFSKCYYWFNVTFVKNWMTSSVYFALHTCNSSCDWLMYFVSAYAIGLIITFVALALMKTGQPALLYLVPCTLGTTFVIGLKRKEVKQLWNGAYQVGTLL